MSATENLEPARASAYFFFRAPLRKFLRPAELIECVVIRILRSSSTRSERENSRKKKIAQSLQLSDIRWS
jgi:hypothetical protein